MPPPPKSSIVSSLLKLLVSLLALAVIISTNFAYKDALYDYSLETVIPDIQKQMSSKGSQTAWLVFSDASLALIPSISIVILFTIVSQRARSIHYSFSLAVSLAIMVFLKAAYTDPRPYWESGTEVQGFHCSTQYGNPSGHTMLSFSCVLIPWLDYCANFDKPGSILAKPIVKVAFLILALSVGCLVALSRLYLGVHSLDQVLYGALLGAWVALTMHFVVMEHSMRHV